MATVIELNTIFKKAEQKVSKRLIKKRTRPSNIYWGKIKDDGTFPMHSGTSIKGVRLGRIHVENDLGWSGIDGGTYCSTDACVPKVPEVIRTGFEEYYWSLALKEIRTDWICLKELVFREMPEEEMAHLEQGLQDATRYVWEEFYRSRYNHMCGHHLVSVVDAADIVSPGAGDVLTHKCFPDIRDGAWIFEYRQRKGADDEIDENHIRVNINPADIGLVSELTLDLLDEATTSLVYEDEAYFAGEAGIDLLDVVLCETKMGIRMAEQENTLVANAMSYGSFDAQQLKRRLGTKKVFRDQYSVRYDPYGMRWYPDTEFNELTLSEAGAYNPNNPQTWPRFVRSHPYVPVYAGTAGIKFIVNPDYKHAPFGISTILTPRVIESQGFPDKLTYGKAKSLDGAGYSGTVEWRNPDWKENENRDKGYFKMRFGAAIKPFKIEEGYSWFHRIDHRVALKGNPCSIPLAPCNEEVLPYCTPGVGPDGDLPESLTRENRPISTGSWY